MKAKNILVGLIIGVVISVAGSIYASMLINVHPLGSMPTGEVISQPTTTSEIISAPKATTINYAPPLITVENAPGGNESQIVNLSNRVTALEKRISALEAKNK